jgi:hypothetical protein
MPLRFGMPREEVRVILGPDPPRVKKLFVSPLPRDTYLALGAHVYYREPDVCEAAESFDPGLCDLPGHRDPSSLRFSG